jgi:hypothetical protein
MANPIEGIWNALKLTFEKINEPKSLLHVIEVGDCWTYITAVEEFIRSEEIGLNTSSDNDITSMLTDVIRICESHVQKLSTFMRNEGIPLPDVTSAKPKSTQKDIPLGVKLTDGEIANGIVLKLTLCLQLCAKGQSDALRSDLGMMWYGFYSEWVNTGVSLKSLMIERGWLKFPPYYNPPGTPED